MFSILSRFLNVSLMRSHVFGCKYRHKSDNLQGFCNIFFEKYVKNCFSTAISSNFSLFCMPFYVFRTRPTWVFVGTE